MEGLAIAWDIISIIASGYVLYLIVFELPRMKNKYERLLVKYSVLQMVVDSLVSQLNKKEPSDGTDPS